MKLINKTIVNYLFISIPLLVIAGILSYFLIKSELKDGIDENLEREKLNVQKLIEELKEPANTNLSYDSLSFIKILNSESYKKEGFSDTTIYNKSKNEMLNFRVLTSSYKFNGINYQIRITRTTQEEEELMNSLFSAFTLIIIFIVLSFVIVSWRLSKRLWKPFYNTLNLLGAYDIKNHTTAHFQKDRITEFNQLNTELNKMTDKIYKDFVQQKEFTENASHEMQTPLAIVKATVSLMMQSPNLKEEEMDQLQTIENTLRKLSALNKTLILLTKIENNQFQKNEAVNLKETITKTLNNYADLIEAKNIQLEVNLSNDLKIEINPLLADILFSNLFQNAIRHNKENGKVTVSIKGKMVSISNSGEPLTINKEDLYVRFKKNDASKDSLGLGLSIVKSIVDNYGYSISYSYNNLLHTFSIQFI